MSNAGFIRKLLASAVARGKSAKEAAGNMLKKEAATSANLISSPIKPAEEPWKYVLTSILGIASLHLAYSQLNNKKEETIMTELVEEVRAVKQLVDVGFDGVIKAKEAELKILKEKECRRKILVMDQQRRICIHNILTRFNLRLILVTPSLHSWNAKPGTALNLQKSAHINYVFYMLLLTSK